MCLVKMRAATRARDRLAEGRGIEPLTFALQQVATVPHTMWVYPPLDGSLDRPLRIVGA